jgi:hypothetical protein
MTEVSPLETELTLTRWVVSAYVTLRDVFPHTGSLFPTEMLRYQQQQEGHPHLSHYRRLSSPPTFHKQPRTPPTSSAAPRPPHPSMSACDPPAMPRSPPACQQTLLASIETSDPTRLSRHDDRLHEKDRGGAKKNCAKRQGSQSAAQRP